MTDILTELQRLAEGWRTKAARLKVEFGAQAPNAIGAAELTLEACAEELERFVSESRDEVPSPS